MARDGTLNVKQRPPLTSFSFHFSFPQRVRSLAIEKSAHARQLARPVFFGHARSRRPLQSPGAQSRIPLRSLPHSSFGSPAPAPGFPVLAATRREAPHWGGKKGGVGAAR